MNDTLPSPQPDKMIAIEASLLHGSLVEAMKSGDYDTFCKVFEALGNDPDIPLRHSYTPWMLWKKVVSDIKLENSSFEWSCQAQPWVNHQIEARLQDAGAGSTQWLFAMALCNGSQLWSRCTH